MDKIKQLIIGVYKISNIVSGRYYIGYSTNINKRFTVHRSKLKQNCHDNIFLQRAYNLDGEDKFNYEIIHICNTEKEAKEIELKYLTDLSIRDKIYNLNYNNSGGDLLTNHPNKDIIREKIVNSFKETLNNMTPEERKQKNGMYGKTHTEEVRKMNSELKKGNINFKGHKHTEESKQKMSEIRKNKNTGENNSFFGKHHSEETKQKIKEKNKGKLPPNIVGITIDNVNYISLADASRQLSIPVPTILWRVKSLNPKFINYKYQDIEDIMLSSLP